MALVNDTSIGRESGSPGLSSNPLAGPPAPLSSKPLDSSESGGSFSSPPSEAAVGVLNKPYTRGSISKQTRPLNNSRTPAGPDPVPEEYREKLLLSLSEAAATIRATYMNAVTFRSMDRHQLHNMLENVVSGLNPSLGSLGLQLKITDILLESPVAWVDLPDARRYFQTLAGLARFLGCTQGNLTQHKHRLRAQRRTDDSIWSAEIGGYVVRFTHHGLYGNLVRGAAPSDLTNP
jgi:hypothetical protein